MKKTVLCLSAALISSNLFAFPVDVETARGLGEKFLSNKMELQGPLSLAYTGRDAEGDKSFYVFQPSGQQGFVLIAADDLVSPVLGYSADRAWATDIPSHIQYWLDEYSRQIDYIVDLRGDQDPQVAAQWKQLESTGTLRKGLERPTVVAPFLTTTWNQAPYYNEYCPPNTPAGCVATAMAQIMFYWGHPLTGSGSYSYNHNGASLNADFSSTTYQWSNMPVALTSSSTAAEVEAVATLMYHCAVSVRMDFHPQGSGAQVISPWGSYPASDLAFKNYFGYKASLKSYYRDDFTSEQWINMLKFEMDNGRPVLYAGFGDLGGHAFDFDGYDNNDFFHVNWGWGGMSDGYFMVSDLSPSALGIGGGGGNFNYNQQALAMLEPANSTLPANPYEPDYDDLELAMSASLNLSVTSVYYNTPFSLEAGVRNVGSDTFRDGFILPLFVDTLGRQMYVPEVFEQTYALNPGEDLNYTFSTAGDSLLRPGVYMVGLVYLKDSVGASAHIIEGGGNVVPFQLLEVLEDPTAVGDKVHAASLRLYPNPADAYLTLQLDATSSPMSKITLTTMSGQELYAVDALHTHVYQLPVQELASGMYLVRLELNDQQVFTRKVVVQ